MIKNYEPRIENYCFKWFEYCKLPHVKLLLQSGFVLEYLELHEATPRVEVNQSFRLYWLVIFFCVKKRWIERQAGRRWSELQNILETQENRLRLYKTRRLIYSFKKKNITCFIQSFSSVSNVLQEREEAFAVLDFLLTFSSRKK